jgi:hypothetical protein
MRFSYMYRLFLLALLTACGGGGGGGSGSGDDGVASTTVTLYASGLSGPKHMAFKGGSLYVANQNTDSIKVIGSSTDYFFASGFSSPIGVRVKGSDVYFTGTNANTGQVVYKNKSAVSEVPTGGHNFYGLAFDKTQLYVAEVSPDQIVRYSISNFQLVSPTINVTQGSPQGLGVFGMDVYATVSNTTTASNNIIIKLSGSSYAALSWGTFSLPNAIVFDDTYAYIANKGDVNGDGGYISRKKMSDNSAAEVFIDSSTKGIWNTTHDEFCGLAGLAISGSYLYASNGTCTSGNNANTVLKIKL